MGLGFLVESLAFYYLNVEMLLGLVKKSVTGVCISPRDVLGAIHSVSAEGSFHQPHNFNEYIRIHDPGYLHRCRETGSPSPEFGFIQKIIGF
jgi:hypothetical protein